jgi:hypothetical protein
LNPACGEPTPGCGEEPGWHWSEAADGSPQGMPRVGNEPKFWIFPNKTVINKSKEEIENEKIERVVGKL